MNAGSEAAKNVSHIVLLDNDFSRLPDIVSEGRRVINNLQRTCSLFLIKTFFAMSMTLIFLVLSWIDKTYSYPFETNNMLILEIFIIGVPSFFLSLQKNDKRVEGNFINYVISKAFPSALLMVFSCVIIIFAKALLTGVNQALSPEIYTTMMVVSITFAGVIMLYRTCQPFNLFRGVLFTLCLIAILICVFLSLILGGEIFGLTKMWPLSQYWHHLLIIATTISLIVPVSSNLDKLGSMMRTNKRNKKDNK
jgi:cation-transporting ATPase E